jgi:putative hydrolase of the HAD superfamily
MKLNVNADPEIKYIGFDADDTLWDNEPFYRALEHLFNEILLDKMTPEESSAELFKTEIANLSLFGYGAKAYTLSIIETALRLTDNKIAAADINRILQAGKQLTDSPLVLLDNVEEVLKVLTPKYKLILATKGDLLDQERKLKKSRLEKYFHHIEIMSDKQISDYEKLLKHLDIEAHEFLMIGNSMRSDIFPILELGGYAIHIPYHTTWAHEKMDNVDLPSDRYMEIETLLKIPDECPWI